MWMCGDMWGSGGGGGVYGIQQHIHVRKRVQGYMGYTEILGYTAYMR